MTCFFLKNVFLKKSVYIDMPLKMCGLLRHKKERLLSCEALVAELMFTMI